jgi:hypothetical protein
MIDLMYVSIAQIILCKALWNHILYSNTLKEIHFKIKIKAKYKNRYIKIRKNSKNNKNNYNNYNKKKCKITIKLNIISLYKAVSFKIDWTPL